MTFPGQRTHFYHISVVSTFFKFDLIWRGPLNSMIMEQEVCEFHHLPSGAKKENRTHSPMHVHM